LTTKNYSAIIATSCRSWEGENGGEKQYEKEFGVMHTRFFFISGRGIR